MACGRKFIEIQHKIGFEDPGLPREVPWGLKSGIQQNVSQKLNTIKNHKICHKFQKIGVL